MYRSPIRLKQSVYAKKLAEVLETDSVIFTDLHRTDNEGDIHIDILIPLVEPGSKNQRPFGIMILRIDPGKILFPLIQSWPTPSKTAETLLLRKDGDSILFLNELRHKNNSCIKSESPTIRRERIRGKGDKRFQRCNHWGGLQKHPGYRVSV